MSQIALTNPVVGASVSGFTSPTYTLSEDVYPGGNNGLQYAVTALGGTQADVLTHSIARPFTLTVSRPKNLVSLGVPGPDGFYNRVGMNVFKVTVRKGVDVTTSVAGQPPQQAMAGLDLKIPAGAASADLPNVKAMISLMIGALNDLSDSLDELVVDGLL